MIVVFDLDGTLIDSRAALLAAHDIAWAELGLARPPDQSILDLVGLPLRDTMLSLAPDQDPEPLIELYCEAYARHGCQKERLFAGVRRLLQRPFRAAVATGKGQRGAERVVAQHGFSGRFEVVLGGDSVRRPKPFPDMLLEVMERSGSRDLVMVGDTTYDLEMAQAAEVRGVGVAWGHHSVERLQPLAPVADTVAELESLLFEGAL
jgi:phosphoglycolate phosphatase